MFLDIIEMIFDGVGSVVSALDVDLFSVGAISITFWEIILGLLVTGIIFSFFLAPRRGSGIQTIVNFNKAENKNSNNSNQKGSNGK